MKDNLVQEQETLKNGDENGPLEPENERKIGSSQGDSAELGLMMIGLRPVLVTFHARYTV
ncbi:hypothetical protein HKBW3S44_00232 [Candidatus Hakubella thermalkaliphila]|uniref:Uncharacterized protein n=2 Tax=Candidatus Hakubella thermalkaliphila TaxID=2754717 RepID=A0A6V8PVC2_9ACTN|nr:hypothetical protein [Candidatus Hakubella thermalkaliphila]GFP36549.1 hypothetical protein HKBW3S44_00232 [Candidatus Hakubella thermalkaliphila]